MKTGLTLMEIARKHDFATTSAIEKAISRGELVAYRLPCGRGKKVKVHDYGRWVESLKLQFAGPTPAAPATARTKPNVIRRSQMPIPH